MMLQKWNGKLIAERFQLPEMEVEVERAVEQVEAAIEKDRAKLAEEKDEVMRAREHQDTLVEKDVDVKKEDQVKR